MSNLNEAAEAAANVANAVLPAEKVETYALQPLSPSQAIHPAQMIQALISSPDVSPEKMALVEKAFELQERFEANVAKKAYFSAVSKFQEDAPQIFFDREVEYSGVEFEFASLAGILKKIRPVLADHGLTLTFRTGVTESEQPMVTACLTHELGYGEDTTLAAPPDTSGKKNPIQAVRSTVSYLKRTTVEALLGLAAERDDNDDGNDAGEPAAEQSKQLPPMPEALFKKNEQTYRERVGAGMGKPAQLIAKLQTKYTLSTEQLSIINAMIVGGNDGNA